MKNISEIASYVAFYWDRMDHWFEEDEEVFKHPTDPYHRVDVRASSRSVQVVLGGETIAESRRARFVFETNHPTRYYVPREDVRMDLLEVSQTQSVCPYKGKAVYWSAQVEGQLYEDVAWSYPDPLIECPKIKGLLCFFNEKVDEIFVAGMPVTQMGRRHLNK